MKLISAHSHIIKNDVNPLLKLAIPLVLTGVVQSSLGFFENIFLARLGEEALAAGGLVGWLFSTLIVIIFGTFGAINILISYQYGAKNEVGMIQVLRDGLLLAALLSIPAFILFWKISIIFTLVGHSPKLVMLAHSYLHGLAWGLLPKFILIVLFEFIIGLGHSRVIMVATILSTPLYILFSYVLIFGKFGFPELGVAGAGWGMTFADWIVATTVCILLLLSKQYRHYIYGIFTIQKPTYLWEILQLGLPMGVMYSFEVGFFFAMTLVMGVIGTQSLAANQIAMQYLGPLMGIIFCIAQAITVRMGHQLGANEVNMANRTAYVGIALSVLLMGMVAICYWTIPGVLISVDFNIHDPSYAVTVRLATEFLFIAAFFQVFESARIALYGALRALKDTRFTLLTSIISFWCVALPVGYVFAMPLHFGGQALWCGMVMGALVSMVMLGWRFRGMLERRDS